MSDSPFSRRRRPADRARQRSPVHLNRGKGSHRRGFAEIRIRFGFDACWSCSRCRACAALNAISATGSMPRGCGISPATASLRLPSFAHRATAHLLCSHRSHRRTHRPVEAVGVRAEPHEHDPSRFPSKRQAPTGGAAGMPTCSSGERPIPKQSRSSTACSCMPHHPACWQRLRAGARNWSGRARRPTTRWPATAAPSRSWRPIPPVAGTSLSVIFLPVRSTTRRSSTEQGVVRLVHSARSDG